MKANGFKTVLTVLLVSVFTISCSKLETKKRADVKPNGNIDESLKTTPDNPSNNTDPSVKLEMDQLGVTENHYVVIQKSALDKEFLFQAQMITQSMVPMFENMKSRVVAFKTSANKVHLLEATKGHVVTHDLPADLLLASYPIVAEDEKSITFDFNTGMKELFVAGDWRGHGEAPDYNKDAATAQVAASFVKSSEVVNNTMVLHQVARITALTGSMPVAMKYYISPYAPSESFRRSRAPQNFDQQGYFEVAPYYNEQGNAISYSSKFDSSKPIVFAVSANTPAEYKQAFRDGILYWNKAFGKTVMEVVDAPEGVTAPDLNYNVVQWVPWDSAGFAYADAVMDPRTGEITHAQVFMTSVFAISSKNKARKAIKNMKTTLAKTPALQIGLKGFQTQSLCHYDVTQKWMESLEAMIKDENLTDAQVLEASRDYIREVIAHEVGHTLGLRHNFAGSLATNMPVANRTQMLKDYLVNMEAPQNTVASSSVMEYQFFLEALISGDQIEKSEKALEYDEKAIGYLYNGTQYDSWPLFCTDDHVQTYQDCERFDYGQDLVAYVKDNEEKALLDMPLTLLVAYEDAKVPKDGSQPTPVAATKFDAEKMAQKVYEKRTMLISALTEKGNLLKVHRQHLVVDDLNKESVKAEEMELLYKSINEMGGLEKVLPPVQNNYSDKAMMTFTQMVESEKYKKGKGFDGTDYEFSKEEIQQMKTRSAQVLEKLQQALASESTKELAKAVLLDHKDNDAVAGLMNAYLNEYVYAKSDKMIAASLQVKQDDKEAGKKPEDKKPDQDKGQSEYKTVEAQLPVYLYPESVRKASIQLLSSSRSAYPYWNEAYQKEGKEKMKEELTQILTTDKLGDIKSDASLDRDVRLWLKEQTAIQSTINSTLN